MWEENNMQTFKDFLVWYNNLDVVPFIEAVEKMSLFLRERTIDMFKDGISVPGLTLKYLFSYLSPQTYFSLFDQANSDLYHLIKDNNTGGPSIIFHRYHEAGKTKIREAEKGEAAKPCEKNRRLRCKCALSLGFDAEHAHGKLYETPSRQWVQT